MTAYGFFLVVSQYADQQLLKSLSQNKTPDLSLKYIFRSKCMTSRVSSKNKGKKAKRKNSVEKQRLKKKTKKRYKEKENSVARGVEPGLSARASNFLTTAPQ